MITTLTRVESQKRGVSIGVFTSFHRRQWGFRLDRVHEFGYAFHGVLDQRNFGDDDHDHEQDE